MKKLFRVFSVVALVSIATTGCETASELLVTKTPVIIQGAQTNYVTVKATNFVPVVSVLTNAETGTLDTKTNLVPQVTQTVQPVILPEISYTNLALSAVAENGVKMAGNVAGVSGVPFASTIAAGISGVFALLFGFFNHKNKNKAIAEAAGHEETKGALETAELVGKTLVENIETIRKFSQTIPGYSPDIDAKIMSVVRIAQSMAGADVKTAIHNLVEENTQPTTPIAKAA